MSTAMQRLESKIESLRNQLHKAEILRDSMADPEFADVFAADAKTPTVKTKAPRPRHGTAFESVSAFFNARNNEWATGKQIREATKLARGAFSNLIYHQRKDEFEKKEIEGQLNTWRMKEVK